MTDNIYNFYKDYVEYDILMKESGDEKYKIDSISTEFFYTKHQVWDYEKEYRVVKNSPSILKIKPSVIYIGNKVKLTDRVSIVTYAEENHIQLYIMNDDFYDSNLKYTFRKVF